MSYSNTVLFAQELIQKPSITPDDCGCQTLIADRLKQLGFTIEHMPSGKVSNLWARLGNTEPLLVLAGHTDVVPTGDLAKWKHDPFSATIDSDLLYGRGSADMKSSIAAMVCAVEKLLQNKQLSGSIAFAITSDEEGDAVDGTITLVEKLIGRGERSQFIIVGEPSSSKQIGDTIRIGRRGSLTGKLCLTGQQGHVAYPESFVNPIAYMAEVIGTLSQRRWDKATDAFPATSFQFVSVASSAGATNVIPAQAEAWCNFRFSNQVTDSWLKQQVEKELANTGLSYNADWFGNAQPFLSQPGLLIDNARSIIEQECGITPELSTGGGTSDGRFLINMTSELIELGPINDTIHQINERTSIRDLEKLEDIYGKLIGSLVFTQ